LVSAPELVVGFHHFWDDRSFVVARQTLRSFRGQVG
jgi:hypothetical protein